MLKKAKEKLKKAVELNKEATKLAKEGIKIKVKEAKEDPRFIALIVVDVLLILLVIMALFFLFDPNLALELDNPLPWELKLVLFIVSVFLAFWIYNYTKQYRTTRSKK